jgi:hypothetical protein
VYRTWIEPDDNAALGIFSDPSYDARNTVMLAADPHLPLPVQAPTDGQAELVRFAPESLSVRTTSPAPSILSVSLVYYPGWQATVDGRTTDLLRADTALTAVAVPPGDHTVQFIYRPQSYSIGLIVSLMTLVLGGFGFAVSVHRANSKPSQR